MDTLTHDNARFCPKCASPAVEFSLLEGGHGRCLKCGWSGTREELLLTPFKHDLGSHEQVLLAFTNEFRSFFAKHAGVVIAKLLDKWGFLPDDVEGKKRVLSHYLTEIARSSVKTILEERLKLEAKQEEKTSDG